VRILTAALWAFEILFILMVLTSLGHGDVIGAVFFGLWAAGAAYALRHRSRGHHEVSE
jgi:hypothetical protein